MSTPAKRVIGGEITNTPGSSATRPNKRAKTDVSASLVLKPDEMIDMGASDELVAHIRTLQSAYSALYLELEQEKKKKQPVFVTEEETWDDAKVADKVSQIRTMANKEITKQMKWQPSCKTGGTRWSYTGLVPNSKVFYALFNLPTPRLKKDHFKQKKLTMDEFSNVFGRISASIRYGSLSLTGGTVTLGWQEADNTFTLKGTYGKGF